VKVTITQLNWGCFLAPKLLGLILTYTNAALHHLIYSLLERAPGPTDITGMMKLCHTTVVHDQNEAQSRATYPRATLCGATRSLWACGHSNCVSL